MIKHLMRLLSITLISLNGNLLFSASRLSPDYQSSTEQLSPNIASLSLHTTQTTPQNDIDIWQIQQTIEKAHTANDIETVELVHEHLKNLAIDETQWQHFSNQLLSRALDGTSPSLHWQNWYSRWVRWECQSSWKDAVISALFFPQLAFLESDNFGNWNGNPAVNYSLAISAAHDNPQALLYHIESFRHLYSIEDDVCEDIENMLEEKVKRMFRCYSILLYS